MTDLEIQWLVTPETVSDSSALRRIRVKDGLLSIYDVIGWVTGLRPKACQAIWSRLLQVHPTMSEICAPTVFPLKGPGRPGQATPATDARGIVQVIMVLPGRAADGFRRTMSDILVRYAGGDPTLVEEIYANRRMQMGLAAADPDNPMRVFGDEVEKTVEDLEWRQLVDAKTAVIRAEAKKLEQESKLLTLQGIALAQQVSAQMGFGFETNVKYQAMVRAAVDAAMLPPGKSPNSGLDAAEYLRLHGHTEHQIACLAGELGKWFKLRRISEGRDTGTSTQGFGPAGEEREIYIYDRLEDREFLASAFKAFQQRPLYKRLCPADEGLQSRALKDLQGSRGMRERGRPQTSRRIHNGLHGSIQ